MKKFILYVLQIGLLFLVILTVLDVIYSSVFAHTRYRSKANRILNMQNEKTDYIILGSSRVMFHLDTDVINDSLGIKGYNLGDPDCGLNETSLMLKLFYAQGNKAKKVFVQIDNNWNSTTPSPLGSSYFIPFYYKKVVRDHISRFGLRYKLYARIPFVRYMYYAPTEGFRELITSIFKDVDKGQLGRYNDLNGVVNPDAIIREEFTPEPNNFLTQEIVELCENNDSKVIFFTAPTLKFKYDDFEFLTQKLDNYTNWSDTISDINLFYDSIHLNRKGSKLLTSMFMHEFFPEQRNIHITENRDKKIASSIIDHIQ